MIWNYDALLDNDPRIMTQNIRFLVQNQFHQQAKWFLVGMLLVDHDS